MAHLSALRTVPYIGTGTNHDIAEDGGITTYESPIPNLGVSVEAVCSSTPVMWPRRMALADDGDQMDVFFLEDIGDVGLECKGWRGSP